MYLFKNKEAINSLEDLEPTSKEKGAVPTNEKYSVAMTFKLPNSAYYWCHENQKIIAKNSQAILCNIPFVERNKEGKAVRTVELRYAENAVPNPTNNQVIDFSPLYITIPVSGIIKTNDTQMIKNFFLCNHVNNGSNKNRPTGYETLFETLDKKEISKKFLENASAEATALSMVLGMYQLTDVELRKVAYVYFHADAALYQFYEPIESMEDNQLRAHMHSLAKRDPKKFMTFFNTTKSSSRETINKAVGKKILVYDDPERKWLMVNEAGVKELVLEVKKDQEAAAALMNLLDNNDVKGIGAAIARRLQVLEAIAAN
jgi:hypothetical protein